MGIKDLNSFLKKSVPQCIEKTHLSSLKGKKIAIDTSIYFYKFLYKHPRFIESFLEQIYKLIKCEITPVYVFDGKPPQEKMKELEMRKNKRIEMKDKINEITDKLTMMKEDETKKLLEIQKIIEESQEKGIPLDLSNFQMIENKELQQLEEEKGKLQKKLIYVTWQHKEELKYFLEALNIPYIQAECEADSICTELCRRNIVDGILSDDMDMLVDGPKILLREFTPTSYMVMKYDLEQIKSSLGLTTPQWIDFCILCGCDYTKRIYGMGPYKCIQYIKKEKNIETILNKYVGEGKKFKCPGDNYNYQQARYLFTNAPFYKEEYDNVCKKHYALNLKDTELQERVNNLLIYLSEMTNYSEKMVVTRLEKILKRDLC